MNRKIFLAGASGVIGRQLGPLLVDADYEVFGTTRSEAKVAELEGAGVKPIVIDVFDAPALSLVMATVGARHRHSPAHGSAARPRSKNDGGGHRTQRADSQRRDAESRRGGPRAASARRLIAQSIAWAYAPGPQPCSENDPLEFDAEGTRGTSVRGIAMLERLRITSQPLEGVVLRYGQLYGPGTGNDQASGSAPLHVDAAAHAALLAVERAKAGVFNIAEDSGFVSIAKARRELGWDPGFRIQTERR